MKTLKTFLIIAAAALTCGCAAFTSGDIRVDKDTAKEMLENNTLTPFSDIQFSWKLYPYHSPSEAIGRGYISPDTGQFKTPEIKPVPADPDDRTKLLHKARRIFSEAGLYDKEKGRGTLHLQLETMNKWTYGELLRSHLTETAFIFILPSSLRTTYLLTADFKTSTGTAKVEVIGTNKTVFHLLMAPLYPLFMPSSGETGLLKQMLWRSATDIYDTLKRAEKAAKENPAAVPVPAPAAAQPAPGTAKPLEPGQQPEQAPSAPAAQPAAVRAQGAAAPASPPATAVTAPTQTPPPSEEPLDD